MLLAGHAPPYGFDFARPSTESGRTPDQRPICKSREFINDFIEYTWTLQNPDGSFSTIGSNPAGNEPNMERKVQTTGHILEWLVFTLPEEKLKDPRIGKSVDLLISPNSDHRITNGRLDLEATQLGRLRCIQQRMYGAEYEANVILIWHAHRIATSLMNHRSPLDIQGGHDAIFLIVHRLRFPIQT